MQNEANHFRFGIDKSVNAKWVELDYRHVMPVPSHVARLAGQLCHSTSGDDSFVDKLWLRAKVSFDKTARSSSSRPSARDLPQVWTFVPELHHKICLGEPQENWFAMVRNVSKAAATGIEKASVCDCGCIQPATSRTLDYVFLPQAILQSRLGICLPIS
jgi:hypothetical protein